jgi:hypothetical protein
MLTVVLPRNTEFMQQQTGEGVGSRTLEYNGRTKKRIVLWKATVFD